MVLMPGCGVQIQAKSEGVAAAWQMVETQRADLAKQQAKLAEQASGLQEDTRYITLMALPSIHTVTCSM